MKIGILGHDFISWGGGIDFLRLVIDSLLMASKFPGSEIYLLLPNKGPRLQWRCLLRAVKGLAAALLGKEHEGERLPPLEIVQDSFREFEGRIQIRRIDIGKSALVRCAKHLGLDVVLPAVHVLDQNFPLPWVGYAYDFQHRYLAENFTPEDRLSRDRHFNVLLKAAQAVIVNSLTAASDIRKFVPDATARIFSLPFAPCPSSHWFSDTSDTLGRYGLEQPFFMISNQFWIHKDHGTALEAFGALCKKNSDVSLICTGSTSDPRNPRYFEGLRKKMRELGVERRVHVLGMIPKIDQIGLMKMAAAVIQPSLFEGGPGGGSVYDAISLGVAVIVSDIPVNREVQGDDVSFFEPGNADALEQLMLSRLDVAREIPDPVALMNRGKALRAKCGNVLWEALESVL